MNKAHLSPRRIFGTAVATAVAVLVLAGCAAAAPGTPDAPADPAQPAANAAELSTLTSSLGEVIVDGRGWTAYRFDKDVKDSGASACIGDCAALWPALTSASATPLVSGVAGDVTTFATADGQYQVQVNGWPLYTFSKDAAVGDVTGQGVGGVWWAVTPSGDKILTAPKQSSDY